MKGSRDNVILHCQPLLVSMHAESVSERALIPFRAVVLLLQMQQGGEGSRDMQPNAPSSVEVNPDHFDVKISPHPPPNYIKNYLVVSHQLDIETLKGV